MKQLQQSKVLLHKAQRLIKVLLFFSVFLLFNTALYAQSMRTISGIVTDELGEPLPGATVAQKRSNSLQSIQAVMCDIQGHFSLAIPDNTQEIEVTFVGFDLLTIKLTEERNYQIIMKSSAKDLDEVVVTGMFTRKANTFSGAVSTVGKEELLRSGNQNLIQSLKNIDPSFVQLDNLLNGSNPNAMPSLQMRGQSAFPDLKGEYQSNPNEPLFILDGFETSLTKIIDLDMNIVESITLLKDATAKAIYGAKAANGVVVIETRRPETGRMRISYNGNLNIEAADLNSYDLANAQEKLEIEKMAGLYESTNVQYHIQLEQKYNSILQEVLARVNTDWLAQPIKTGIGQKHAVYLEGGDQNMIYGVDLSYNNITGVMKGSDRNTFNGGITLSYRTKNLMFRNKLSVTHNVSNESPWGTFSEYAVVNPYNRLYDTNDQLIQKYQYLGRDAGSVDQTNPIWNSTINTKNFSKYTDITNNFYAEWSIKPTFKIVGRFGITLKNSSTDNFKPGSHTQFANYTGDKIYSKGSYYKSNGEMRNLNGDIGVNYSLEINRHALFLNGQLNITNYSFDSYNFLAEGFTNDNMDHISFGTQYAKDKSPDGDESVARTFGGVASLNYSYDDRYLVDLNYRLTGSSEFGANSRWGSFWSVGGGWNVHQEAFLKNNKYINRLKLRVSTGYTGSQGFRTYDALATLKYYTSSSYNGHIGSYLVGLANPNLQWQKKYDQNFGVDFILFNNKLSGRFDYYTATTTGMITDITVPQSTGFGSYRENMGETENKGFEANLNYKIWENTKTRSFVQIYASVAKNTNKLKKISESLRKYNSEQDALKDLPDDLGNKEDKTTPSVRFVEGQSLNAIWVVKSLGIDPTNGKEIYVKKNGDITYQYSSADQIVGGDNLPKYNGNFGMNVEYKNIGLNIAMGYHLGGQIYNETLIKKVENADLRLNVDRRVFTARWQKPGDKAMFKSIQDFSPTRPTSRFIEDYDLLNIASVSVSYDFSYSKFIKESFLSRLKIQFYVNDLATFSSVDIERGTAYPFARNFSFSLQASF